MKKIGFLIFITAIVISLTMVWALTGNSLLPSLPKMFVKIKGSGVMRTERREVPTFSAVKLGGATHLEIRAGEPQSVEIETDDNLLELTKAYVKNDTLHIERRGNIWTSSPLRIRITVAELNRLDLSGASKADVKNVRTDKFELDLNGASKINLEGEVATFIADMSGASNLDAENLKTAKAVIEASGASKANIFVTEDLNADASGASKIFYAGNPKTVREDESGASRVSPR
ncbi:MAG: DUF2807 domain-containing protein [Acidobacteriota bacterium]|nr:DUF2807 domain-containing protein [Acidobacteriota bacterium]